ncbi:hypothetical protein A264_17134 [Pseudomonas syringae pv. actinidiae ICMP 19071]|nr:hypothetical protein A264_17134 [Pseudomonas syringae pv. actinidiae ICMP 19071]EPM59179.1 hypothetical protein A262_10372 [Pseudomonas syringae pv. actinidiae ICMP 19073]EPM76756.1 hypothetical protein A3SO_16555 [Pseudomonas syringae pv. actinidiae ICMP 19072]OSN63522.1 hypothetical protein BV349_04467 [Pseudomonas syringae pv. actinidiae]OSN73589.1 hypothetical protein BV351_04410 [Pseudomonas syringae pv. actinidiae]
MKRADIKRRPLADTTLAGLEPEAVCHALAGYLSCSAKVLGLRQIYTAEQGIFNRLLAHEGVEPQTVEELAEA